jgi:uncharacterized flavoprotein (TIGR03862 family)
MSPYDITFPDGICPTTSRTRSANGGGEDTMKPVGRREVRRVATTELYGLGVSKRALVIGGGPSGLMAAEVLAEAGHEVTVVDRMRTPGRKLTLAGRGGLNITHSESLSLLLGRYRPTDERLLESIVDFPPEALRAWVAGLGEDTFVGTSGRVFPGSFGATALLRSWLDRLRRSGVVFEGGRTWLGFDVDPASGCAIHRIAAIANDEPQTMTADVTVLALGGASWPGTGSDGGWVAEIRRHHVTVHDLVPSNCGYRVAWSERFRSQHAGKPLKNVALNVAGSVRRGEVLVTDEGLEGGLIYACGSDLRALAGRGEMLDVEIDLRADVSVKTLTKSLGSARGSRSMSTWLQKRAHLSTTGVALLRESTSDLPQDPAELARLIKAVPLRLAGPSGIARAISTAGGIAFDEIDDRFMLYKLPGVFVAGEMLDWDAPTGGYLLQASCSTGIAAGRGAASWLDQACPDV